GDVEATADEGRVVAGVIVRADGDDMHDAAGRVHTDLGEAGRLDAGRAANQATLDKARLAPGRDRQVEHGAVQAGDGGKAVVGAGHVAAGEAAGVAGVLPVVEEAVLA